MLSTRQLYFSVWGTKPTRKAPRHRNGRGPARSHRYRGWIRNLPCAACGAERGIEAAHTVHNGMASKGSDYSCVPLCFSCHREYDSGLRSKDLFEADHNLNLRELVSRLNHDWFAYSKEVK